MDPFWVQFFDTWLLIGLTLGGAAVVVGLAVAVAWALIWFHSYADRRGKGNLVATLNVVVMMVLISAFVSFLTTYIDRVDNPSRYQRPAEAEPKR